MTIIPGDYPSSKAPQAPGRGANSREPAARQDEGPAAHPGKETPAVTAANIRARLVELQRNLAGHQRLLGGLYGLRDLLQAEPPAPAAQIKDRTAALLAENKTLPETLRKALIALESGADRKSLNAVILVTERAIAGLSASLGKTEIADQNAQSLTARASLAEVARGLRESGSVPQRLSRDQVLKLLS